MSYSLADHYQPVFICGFFFFPLSALTVRQSRPRSQRRRRRVRRGEKHGALLLLLDATPARPRIPHPPTQSRIHWMAIKQRQPTKLPASDRAHRNREVLAAIGRAWIRESARSPD